MMGHELERISNLCLLRGSKNCDYKNRVAHNADLCFALIAINTYTFATIINVCIDTIK